MKPLLLLLYIVCMADLHAQDDPEIPFYVHRYLLDSAAQNSDSSFVALQVFRSHKTDSLNNLYVDLVFINNAPEATTIQWYDFKRSWGVPICASFSIVQTDTVGIDWVNFRWAFYMDPPVYQSYKKVIYDIDFQPYEVVVKTIRLWWVGMKVGVYDVQLDFYDRSGKRALLSNVLSIDLEKRPQIK